MTEFGAGPDTDLPDEPAHEAGHAEVDHAGWPVIDDGFETSPPGRRRRIRHPVLAAFGIIVVVIVLLVGGGILWAKSQISPGGHPGAKIAVSIPKGSSTSRIGKILSSAGVIHQGSLFALYVKLNGDGPLLPGKYQLAKNSSYQDAITALRKGPVVLTDTLVIPEGYTIRQIAARVAALPGLKLSAQKFLAAASDGTVRSPYEPAGVDNLEGLLFPATYKVHQGESEVEVLEQMVGAFDAQASEIGLQAQAARMHYTPYQVLTVASIIEKEAKLTGDRGPVASVIYNRLKVKMPLGADSTETYYLRLANPDLQPTAAEDNQAGPFNTRLHAGLPPTPIANPGLPSLKAATAPPTTPYLFFVEVNPDGKLGFASDQSGFAHLQAQCQTAHLC